MLLCLHTNLLLQINGSSLQLGMFGKSTRSDSIAFTWVTAAWKPWFVLPITVWRVNVERRGTSWHTIMLVLPLAYLVLHIGDGRWVFPYSPSLYFESIVSPPSTNPESLTFVCSSDITDWYFQFSQIDEELVPVTFNGPVETPPIPNYLQDGVYRETTRSYEMNPEIVKLMLDKNHKSRKIWHASRVMWDIVCYVVCFESGK